MRSPRPPLPVASAIPVRAHGVRGRRGHRGIIPDDPDTPTAACVAPAEPWHLHMRTAEIAPVCPDCCLCTLRSIDLLLRGLSGRSLASSSSTLQRQHGQLRVEECGPRRSEWDRLPRARCPRRSAAVSAPFAAAERFSASPCSPSHISCCAGRSDYVACDFLAGQFMPSARHSAQSASRACALA